MKVAVSIPDEIFAEAESLAKQFGTSRSELYSRALGVFIGLHTPERLTQAMNEAVDAAQEESDAFSAEAARRALRNVEW
jgi:metal-responsive CopG/Arc/MetJ family transcriptional regulator